MSSTPRTSRRVLDELRRLGTSTAARSWSSPIHARLARAADRVIEIRDGRGRVRRCPPFVHRSSSPSMYGVTARSRVARARRGRPFESRPASGSRCAALGLGQDDAAARPRRARRADRARWMAGRPLSRSTRRARRVRRAGSPTSSRAPTCCRTSRRTRTSPSLPRQRRGRRARTPLPSCSQLVGLAAKARPPARRAFRRRGAARRARPRARPAPAAAALRRADRHLDSDTGGRVLDLIDALQQEFGFALVIATHDEDVAERHGKRARAERGPRRREESR